MNALVIPLPATSTTDDAHSFIESMKKYNTPSFASEAVVFDFSACKCLSPVILVYIKMWRDTLVSKGIETFYRSSNPATDSFFKRMGLLPSAKDEKNIESRFLYHIHPCMSTAECSAAHKDIVSNVVRRGCLPDETFCAIDYMINELWDNAGVHGYGCYEVNQYPNPVYICALEFNKCFEVCIGDRGQGIHDSLRKNTSLQSVNNSKNAVKTSIKNGISGHPNGSPGFGLYSAAEFIRKGSGELFIWSSRCFLRVGAENEKIYSSSFDSGTLVSFIISKDSNVPFEAIMNTHARCSYSSKEYIEEVIGGLFDEQ